VERTSEEEVLMKGNQRVAKVVPAGKTMTAREAFRDLGKTLTDEEDADWLKDSRAGIMLDI
jgi:hypothetical protein